MLVLLIVAAVGGAYVLKLTRGQAAAAGGYYQARSAALAAQAGLEAGLAQLEADPAAGVARLNAYLADPDRRWLLGSPGDAGSRTLVAMDNGLQRYAARIVAFDPATSMIKLEGFGEGPGGSESRAYGIWRLGGLTAIRPVMPKYVWYMAGETRNVDATVDVWGDAYFGGGVHFNGGADGSVMHGTLKIARGSGLTSSFDCDIYFCKNTYVQTPFKAQGLGPKFCMRAGFEADLFLDTDLRWVETPFTAWFNGGITGGHSGVDMMDGNVIHSGALDPGRLRRVSSVRDNGGPIDIAAALGMDPGPESELAVDLSAIPATHRFTPATLGIARWGNTNGPELSAAYDAQRARGGLYRDFLVVEVRTPLHFLPVPNNILRGKFIFDVTSSATFNGHLPESDPASVSLWRVGPGGWLSAFGNSTLFRGYVNVSGDGRATYQWTGDFQFQGALHHVSPASGFQMNGASGGQMSIHLNSGVFDELAATGVLVPPGPSAGPGTGSVRLVDTRIRPLNRSRWF